MNFILIVREFTAMSLADAKGCMDRLESGEELELQPSCEGQATAFADKLLKFAAVEHATVKHT